MTPKTVILTVGEWVQQQRKLRNWTQKELADKLAYSIEMLRKVEQGRNRPSRSCAIRLAVVFEIAPADRAHFVEWAHTQCALRPYHAESAHDPVTKQVGIPALPAPLCDPRIGVLGEDLTAYRVYALPTVA
jgi:transcriptional regulator with XRE-family HTH domain